MRRRAATTSASRGAMIPAASGRAAVRATCASKSRSAQSFIAQPAERMTSVPTQNTSTIDARGAPSAASHSADSVGHSSSSVPIGLSSRISRSYASSRSTSVSLRRGVGARPLPIAAIQREAVTCRSAARVAA